MAIFGALLQNAEIVTALCMSSTQALLTFTDQPAMVVLHPAPKARRDAIKAAGGPAYEALLAKERADIAARRERNGRRPYDRKTDSPDFKTRLCARARQRGRKRGLPATIRPDDIEWPSHCPVLGMELDYPARGEHRASLIAQANWPSLDRWDSSKGYVPGNVFVISYRANTLKNSATYEEILRVAKYLSRRPR